MIERVIYLRNYDYEQLVKYGSIWTVNKAVDYLATYLVNSRDWAGREQAFEEFLKLRGQFLTAMKESINDGSLAIIEEYGYGDEEELNFDGSTAMPFVFINWAISREIRVHPAFEQYAFRKGADKTRYYEGLGVRMSTIHHERCRAIAELLWSREPDMTISQMARREEIHCFGCDGREYDIRTISRWLASLKTERPLGRPRKKTGQSISLPVNG